MEYTRTITIDASPTDVWAVLGDVERWPEWTPTMTSVQIQGGPPLEEGVSVRVKQPRLPPTMWTVTTLIPGRAFSWEARRPGSTGTADHEVDPGPNGGSTVTLRFAQHGPLGAIVGGLYAGMIRRYVDTEAESLRRRVESGPG